MSKSNILAIDFGLKHVGVAIYINDLILSLPDIVYIKQDDFITKINQLASEYNANTILLGIPPRSPRLENIIRTHGNNLKSRTRKVVYLNEDLTSKIYDKTDQIVSDHSMAAREILSEYLGNID